MAYFSMISTTNGINIGLERCGLKKSSLGDVDNQGADRTRGLCTTTYMEREMNESRKKECEKERDQRDGNKNQDEDEGKGH